PARLQRPPRRGSGDDRPLHSRHRGLRPPPSGTVLLAAPPVETSTAPPPIGARRWTRFARRDTIGTRSLPKGTHAMTLPRLITLAIATGILCLADVRAEDKKGKDEPKWKVLFDGKSLEGWKSAYSDGSGKVEVKDGAIVMPKGEKMTGVTYTRGD